MYETYDLLSKNFPASQQITLQKISMTGKNNWAIRKGIPRIVNDRWADYQELSKKGVWSIPPHPAYMSYAWMIQHRWDDPNEALAFWRRYYLEHKKEFDKLQKKTRPTGVNRNAKQSKSR